jgi:hypothetical protein
MNDFSKHVDDLLAFAKKSHNEALVGSSVATRASQKVMDALHDTLARAENAKEIVAQKIKLKFKLFEDVEHEQKLANKTVENIISWLAQMFKDVISRINDQGEILAFLVEKVGLIMDRKDTNLEDLLKTKLEELEHTSQQKQAELENEISRKEESFNLKQDELDNALQQKQTDLEHDMKKKTDDMEKAFNDKHEDLEKKCDEARQRGLKGNLIVSSPGITNARGTQRTQAVPRERQYPHGWGNESMVEMVLRMVHTKTSVRISPGDVVACHPIGQRGSHTFILSIANRRPGSAWDMLTYGMATGENFTNDNIFINYQLTKRRGKLSKEVRQAKSDNLIEKYSTDANGRIFVKKHNDTKKYPIESINELHEVTTAPTGE